MVLPWPRREYEDSMSSLPQTQQPETQPVLPWHRKTDEDDTSVAAASNPLARSATRAALALKSRERRQPATTAFNPPARSTTRAALA